MRTGDEYYAVFCSLCSGSGWVGNELCRDCEGCGKIMVADDAPEHNYKLLKTAIGYAGIVSLVAVAVYWLIR